MLHREACIYTDEEIQLLEKYAGKLLEKRYDGCSKDGLEVLCRLKDRNIDLFMKRYQAAWEVIDTVARAVGIDPDNSGFWLYALDSDGNSAIVNRINEWISRAGDKAQIKKRLQELEDENRILRSLLQK